MRMSNSNTLSVPRPYLLALASLLVLLPELAHATDTAEGGSMPYETPLKALTKSIRGPVAFGISLIGIVAAGAVLIFGGEMSGFLRTLVFLILVIAIIVNAAGLIKLMGGDGATLDAQASSQRPGMAEHGRSPA